MPEVAALIVGLTILSLVAWDVLATTLSLQSVAGPMTRLLMRAIWSVLRRGAGPVGAALKARAGPAVLLATVAAWVVMLWAGWWLVLLADDGGVVEAATGAPASASERLYVAGFSISTVGLGDFRPMGAGMQLAINLAGLSGLVLATLAISYLVPVVSAVLERRQQAGELWALGPDPQRLLLAGWDGTDFSSLSPTLTSVAPGVLLTAERHNAYPVLHYFHGGEPSIAFPVRVAALDEALGLLRGAIAPEVRPDEPSMRQAEHAVTRLLEVVAGDFTHAPSPASPPPPAIEELEAAGVPMRALEEQQAALQSRGARRGQLKRFVTHTGWCWDDVHDPAGTRDRSETPEPGRQ